MQYDIGEEKNLREINKNQFIAIFAVILIIAVIFLTFNLTRETCGNSICRGDENCFDCPKDCKCEVEEYCSAKEKTCIKPTCGDGNCEPYENSGNCCDDCPCISEGEVCNKDTHVCWFPINLTDERAIELTRKYFEEKGDEVLLIEIVYTGLTDEGEVAKFIRVNLKKCDRLNMISITGEGIIKEELIY